MPRYTLNAHELAAKTVDGETVLINLSTGVYYSIAGSGALAFAHLAAGAEPAAVAAELAARYAVDEAPVASDLEPFLASLLAERVLVPTDDVPAAPVEATPADGPYAPPLLEVYTDMGDLLALDPPMPGLQDIPWEAPSR
ncbi:MAG: PqqD family peptide modification chaperone [Thermoleophilia bacterium]